MKQLLSRQKLYILTRLLISVCIAVVITLIKLDFFEFYLYDFRIALNPKPPHTDQISIVFTNSNTIDSLTRYPTINDYIQAVEQIVASKPKALIFDVKLESFVGNPYAKSKLSDLILSFPNHFVITSDLKMKGIQDRLSLPEPFEKLTLISGPKTSDKANFAKDNVTRRILVTYQEQPSLHLVVSQLVNPLLKDLNNIKGLFEFYDSQQVFIQYAPKGSFNQISLQDLINKNFDPSLIKDKIIIIGEDLGKSAEDYVMTPYSREAGALSKTEMHANMINTLIQNNSPIRVPFYINFIFTLLITVLAVHVVLALKPLKGILILVGSSLFFITVSVLAFWFFNIWIQLAQPILSIFVSYYFFIPYRLIVENRKNWEYIQKNNLLTQVEELKTNFISMMSHDLKTPLARIQGMAQIITSDKTALSPKQQEAVDTIRQSTEDLIKFISSILKYGQIESQQLQLHLESRDINELIKEVVKKNEFLAKLKHIQIITELEPLFSIKIDPELIKQVLSNLLENSIKYSPEHTKVLITSEERDSKVVIQLSDQGLGIPSEELPNIFMKFFRSKHAKASPIKGSGLGLYLAKYFVELHKGQLTVESEVGVGSTFTVELPFN